MQDEFGRTWETTIDFIANGPCAPINPKFKSPLDYPQKYLKFQGKIPHILKIDWDTWIADLEVGHRDWDTRLYDDAIMLFGQAGLKMYTDKAPELLRHTGPKPQPVELVKAAKAGNKFILGLSDQMPEWAKPFMVQAEKPVLEFPDAEDELDKYGDIEEAVDPEATGGKKLPVRKRAQAA